jgi:phosphatidylinositol glycan class V
VGLFRYWTLDQLPLFLLATPAISVLLISGTRTLQDPITSRKHAASATHSPHRQFVRTLAAAQTVLAVLALIYYHVQIITRISSAYPVWYWWVAGCLLDKSRQKQGLAIVTFMVMYAGIQGGLFASFLPPA